METVECLGVCSQHLALGIRGLKVGGSFMWQDDPRRQAT